MTKLTERDRRVEAESLRSLAWGKAYRLIRTALVALGLVVILVTFTPLVPWWGRVLAGEWNDPTGDVLIVLGGSSGDDGMLAWSSLLRAQYAIRACRSADFHVVLISGGPAASPVSQSMADYLRSHGVPAARLIAETNSSSTRENALQCRRILSSSPQLSGRLVLLTSDYHMFRAHRVFAKAGIDVLPRPIPDVLKRGSTWQGRWPAFLDLSVETIKIGYYFLRGWM
jgi:uncharacterized SAM-binding protein YcdF (DUF218 family)